MTFNADSYWEDRLRQNDGLRGVGYTHLGHQYNYWSYRVRRAVFLRTICSIQQTWNSANILDVGSGTGFYIQLWKQVGVRSVTGSDLTKTAVTRLTQCFPRERILSLDVGREINSERLGRYDVVSAFDVLFHIIDDARHMKAIENISSLLSPDGLFLFSDIFVHGPTLRGEHVVFRSLEELTRLLSSVGFEILFRIPMFVVMNEPLDIANPGWRFLWTLMTYPVRKSEVIGFLLGGLLYPLELVLTKVLKESPTTEIIVCRKINC
jgi:2-polyprenyl-3-methyl-5-hydroxy-6-metoxy-1,4-benzoquinol methylase